MEAKAQALKEEKNEFLSRQTRGTLLMVLATVCLSNATILSKFIYGEGVGLVTMLVLRFGLATALLWLFFLGAKGWRPLIRLNGWRHFWACVAVGAANSGSQILFYIGLLDLDPGLSQMIFSLNPVIVALIMLGLGEHLTRLKLGRLALGLGGLYCLTVASGGAAQRLNPLFVLPVICAAIVYALHLVLYQKLLPRTDSRTNTLYILTTMTVIYALLEPLAPEGWGAVGAVSGLAWLYIGAMAVLATAIARMLMFTGIALIGGTQVALIGIGEPVIVLFSSILLLHEQLAPVQWLGAALVIASIALAGARGKGAARPDLDTTS